LASSAAFARLGWDLRQPATLHGHSMGRTIMQPAFFMSASQGACWIAGALW
jgi:hypothetical protein